MSISIRNNGSLSIKSSGSLSMLVSGGLRPLVDANHIHVWNCDEASGSTLVDSVGGANLTINGTSGVDYTLGETPGGSAWSFVRGLQDGTSYILAESSALNVSVSAITTECVVRLTALPAYWTHRFTADVRSDSGPLHAVFAPNISDLGYGYKAWGGLHKEGASSQTSASSYINGVADITTNVTYHMMFTYDSSGVYGEKVKMYINGVLASQQDGSVAGSLSNMNKFSLGGLAGNNSSLQGYIRDVRLSNIARDATYAAAAYAALVP